MKSLLTINDNDFQPEGYTIRKVVRAIILDASGTKVLFFGSTFPGGGVEEGETDEQALVREAMEEVGAKIEIMRPIGETVAYREFLKLKYVSHGYLCRQIGELQKPTTTDPEEQGTEIYWIDMREAIKKLEDELESLARENQHDLKDDGAQRRIHHRKMSLAFLKETVK